MNPVDEKWLAEIVARANKATEGPWLQDPTEDIGWWAIGTEDAPIAEVSDEFFDETEGKQNADFITHAREDVPDLAEALREAWDENKQLREALERFCSVDPDASIAERVEDAKAACAALGLPYQPGDDEEEEP